MIKIESTANGSQCVTHRVFRPYAPLTNQTYKEFDMAEIKLAHAGQFFKLILKWPEGHKYSFLTSQI
jgi:hypothetical protein